ncbi:MAG: hypothetical protein LBG43_06895 [Treponema sp.]|jgi:hypothetical protein|nr:hypothetical protein [Treponema sp.]
MKTKIFLVSEAAFALTVALALAGCGGGSPKTLAKRPAACTSKRWARSLTRQK